MLCGLSCRSTCRRYSAGFSIPILFIGDSFAMSFIARGARCSRPPSWSTACRNIFPKSTIEPMTPRSVALANTSGPPSMTAAASAGENPYSLSVSVPRRRNIWPKWSRVDPAAGVQNENRDGACVNRKNCRRPHSDEIAVPFHHRRTAIGDVGALDAQLRRDFLSRTEDHAVTWSV